MRGGAASDEQALPPRPTAGILSPSSGERRAIVQAAFFWPL